MATIVGVTCEECSHRTGDIVLDGRVLEFVVQCGGCQCLLFVKLSDALRPEEDPSLPPKHWRDILE